MDKIKISIPKPCNENWENMSAEEKGRFCSVCSKTVIDFTSSTNEEISNYFLNIGSSNKVCGRFKVNQLSSFSVQIPLSVFSQKMTFQKAFFLSLFIVMGTSLLSCKDVNNQTYTLGKISVVEDSSFIEIDSLEMKEVKRLNKNKLTQVPELTGVVITDTIVAREPEVMGDIICDVPDKLSVQNNRDYYLLFELTDMPVFNSKEESFEDYLKKMIVLPENGENQLIVFEFKISETGKIEEVKTLRGKNETLNNQIIEIIKNSPKWIPGKINDKNVKVKMTYPIRIKM